MRDRFVLAAVIAVVGLLVPATAGAAAPPGLECGQVITTDVVLGADLTCAGDGLVVAASGITVDLAGHTIASIDGTGVGIRIASPTTAPPQVCFGDIRIAHGTITGFSAGIREAWCPYVGETVQSEASWLTLLDNGWGVYLTSGHHFVINHTRIVGANGVGDVHEFAAVSGSAAISASSIQVTSPDGYSFYAFEGTRGSTIDSSRLEGGQIFVENNLGLTISSSQLVDVPIGCWADGLGISDTAVIGGGIRGSDCGVRVTDDRFLGRGSGVAISTFTTYGSTVLRSAFVGWDTAVELTGFPFSVEDNVFWRNGTGASISSGLYGGVVVRGNRFVDNSGTGLRLRAGTFFAGEQGIVVGSNTALRNGGLGIDAQATSPDQPTTITDEGGNIARRNQEPQCIGVVCARH